MPLLRGREGRIGRVKVRRHIGWDKDSLVIKNKQPNQKHNKERGKEKQVMRKKRIAHHHPSPWAKAGPAYFCLPGISLWSAGNSYPICVPSWSLLNPQSPHWWGEVRSRRGLHAGKYCLEITKTSLFINTVSSTNPKHFPIPSTVKKFSFIPVKTSTSSIMCGFNL